MGVKELKLVENDYLQRWAVSRRINSSKADSNDPTLIDAVREAAWATEARVPVRVMVLLLAGSAACAAPGIKRFPISPPTRRPVALLAQTSLPCSCTDQAL